MHTVNQTIAANTICLFYTFSQKLGEKNVIVQFVTMALK